MEDRRRNHYPGTHDPLPPTGWPYRSLQPNRPPSNEYLAEYLQASWETAARRYDLIRQCSSGSRAAELLKYPRMLCPHAACSSQTLFGYEIGYPVGIPSPRLSPPISL